MAECDYAYEYTVNELSSIIIDEGADLGSEEDVPSPPNPIMITSTPKRPNAKPVHKCGLCSFGTRSRGNLTRHVKCKHTNRVFTCDTCSKRFLYMYMLQQHVRAIHRGDKLMCEVCSKGFNYHATLARHKQVVHQKRFNFQCSFCQKKFFDKGHYHGHINTHVKSKPFKCQTCDKCYPFESSLRRHTQSCLARANRFQCNICQTVLASKVSLHDHTVGMHGGKDKLCVCGKRFSWRSSFTRHQKSCRILCLNK